MRAELDDLPRMGPSESRPPILPFVFLAILGGGLVVHTRNELDAVERLSGRAPGSPPQHLVVGEYPPSTGELAAVALFDPARGRYEIAARPGQFDRLRRGSTVTVRCDESTRECFLPDSTEVGPEAISRQNVRLRFGYAALVFGIGALLLASYLR